LLGSELGRKTVGIVGTGRIGLEVARIMGAFGCKVLGFDPRPNEAFEQLGLTYVPLETLLETSDIITLHCPLTPETHHLIDARAVSRMKPGVMLVNTSRGAVIDTGAVTDGLKTGVIGSLALDTYEEEADLFFEDLSEVIIKDDVFARLLTFPNVLITGHQAFFTREALAAISETTLGNIDAFDRGDRCHNAVTMSSCAEPS